MVVPRLSTCVLVATALCMSLVHGHKHRRAAESSTAAASAAAHTHHNQLAVESVAVNSQTHTTRTRPVAALAAIELNNVTVQINTTSAKNVPTTADTTVIADVINGTALVIARDTESAYSAYSGLNDHGIPYSYGTFSLQFPLPNHSFPYLRLQRPNSHQPINTDRE
jgi:hypothetical protein